MWSPRAQCDRVLFSLAWRKRLEAIPNLEFWQDRISANCLRAGSMKIKDLMIPATECIDEDAPLTEAIHKIVMWQTLSILVKREGEVIGILRVSDLFAEIADNIRAAGD